jgi:hypothetical protein
MEGDAQASQRIATAMLKAISSLVLGSSALPPSAARAMAENPPMTSGVPARNVCSAGAMLSARSGQSLRMAMPSGEEALLAAVSPATLRQIKVTAG